MIRPDNLSLSKSFNTLEQVVATTGKILSAILGDAANLVCYYIQKLVDPHSSKLRHPSSKNSAKPGILMP